MLYHRVILLFTYFFLCVHNSNAEVAPDLIKRGRFYCTVNGKLIVNRAKDGAPSVICIATDGSRYNGITGEIIYRSKGGSGSALMDAGVYKENAHSHKARKGKGKKTTVINNYYADQSTKTGAKPVAAAPISRNKEDRDNKAKSIATAPVKSRPFTGIYIGMAYGFNITNINESISIARGQAPTIGSATDRIINETFNQTLNGHQLYFIVGGNLQVHKNFMIGLEVGGAMLSGSSIEIPGSLFSQSHLRLLKDIAFTQVRIGAIISNKVALYVGGGITLSRFATAVDGSTTGSSLDWRSIDTVGVAPRITAGAEWLILKHLILRLEYEFTYYIGHNSSTADRISGDKWSFEYNGMEHVIRGVIAYKF